jgi:CheY-like chemotaxis protein
MLSVLRRPRASSTSGKRRKPTPFHYRLAFERLENRCLMSSGFDSGGVIAPNTLQSPLQNQDAKWRFAIRRISTDLADPGLTDRRQDSLRLGYDRIIDRNPLLQRRPDALLSERGLERPEREIQIIRPAEQLADRRVDSINLKNTETERRIEGLNGNRSEAGIANRDSAPAALEREVERPDEDGPGEQPPSAPAWRAGGTTDLSDWNPARADRFEARTRDPNQLRIRQPRRSPPGQDFGNDAPSEEGVAAYFIAEATAADSSELRIDLDVLGEEMAPENDAVAPPVAGDAPFIEVPAVGDNGLAIFAIDSAFVSFSDERSPLGNESSSAAAVTLSAIPVVTASEEERAVSLAAATAVLVASRVESRRGETRNGRKRNRLGWLGVAAQFMLARRFTSPRRPKILLAIRDEGIRDRFTHMLWEEGYSVIPVGTLREAVEQIKAPWETFDAAVMDAELDFSAIHLCHKIREKYPRMPVVVCSEVADDAELRQFRRLGARRCLQQPVDPGELLATVNALVW